MRATARPPAVVLDRLRAVSLFAGCTARELERIAGLGCQSDVATRTLLCRQGVVGRQTFVILEGEAAVTIDGAVVAHLGPGTFFGEMSVIDGTQRVASVTAATDMTVLTLSPQELGELMDVPKVVRRMLATVSDRLRLADRSLGRHL